MREILLVIGSRSGGDLELSAKKGGAKLSDELLHGVGASDLIQKLLSNACMYFECPPAKSSD